MNTVNNKVNILTSYQLTAEVYLVETNQIKLTTHVDPLRTDAKDADALQTPLSVHDASRHGRR